MTDFLSHPIVVCTAATIVAAYVLAWLIVLPRYLSSMHRLIKLQNDRLTHESRHDKVTVAK